jgi:uncharacterized protein YdaU (DUF1376 family)
MNYYPFHIGDYLSATRHLSWEEDAAFRRLLDTYYTIEKALPAELRAVCRLVLATTDTQREAVAQVLKEFFELTECGWVNHRADSEIAEMKERQQAAKAKANKRWDMHRAERSNAPAMPQHKESNAAASKTDANAMLPTPTPTPTPTPKINTPQAPEGFAKFWEAWPANDRKQAKGKCWEAWKKAHAEAQTEIVLAHVSSLKSSAWLKDNGQFVPAPLVYLNQRRWEGAEPIAAQRSGVLAGAI